MSKRLLTLDNGRLGWDSRTYAHAALRRSVAHCKPQRLCGGFHVGAGYQLSVVRGGGIGGFVTRTEIADDALPAEEAQQLKEEVEQAGVLRMAAAPDPKQAAPDEMQHEFVVEDEGRLHRVSLSESALTDDVSRLGRFLAPQKTADRTSGRGMTGSDRHTLIWRAPKRS